MTVRNLRKKPVCVTGCQWTGNNINEMREFMRGCGKSPKISDGRRLKIQTLNGIVYLAEGEWVVKGVNDEFYPCDNEILLKTYDFI